jgi:hypothetical protein
VALWFGVLAGVVALPKTGYEVWQTLMSKPSVTASASTPLRLKYEPGTRVLTFSFGLVLHNEGTGAEKIRTANAYFGVPGDVARRQAFNATNITMKAGEAVIPTYLPLAKDDFKSLLCEIQTPLTKELRSLMHQHETHRELTLVLVGDKDRQYAVNFNFDMSKSLTDELLESKASSARTIQFVGSNLR